MAYAAQLLRFLDHTHTHTHIHIKQDSSGLVIGPSHRQVRSLSSIQSILTGKKEEMHELVTLNRKIMHVKTLRKLTF